MLQGLKLQPIQSHLQHNFFLLQLKFLEESQICNQFLPSMLRNERSSICPFLLLLLKWKTLWLVLVLNFCFSSWIWRYGAKLQFSCRVNVCATCHYTEQSPFAAVSFHIQCMLCRFILILVLLNHWEQNTAWWIMTTYNTLLTKICKLATGFFLNFQALCSLCRIPPMIGLTLTAYNYFFMYLLPSW